MADSLVLVTSVILSSTSQLCYGAHRSIFSPVERAFQTTQTLKSVRRHIPGASVCLIEGGYQEWLPSIFGSEVDTYIFVGSNRLLRRCIDSPYKGLGETAMLLYAARHLDRSPRFFYKLSGRYQLNTCFDISEWRSGGFTFKADAGGFSTRFYGFSKDCFNYWLRALWLCIPFLLTGRSIESILPWFLPSSKVRTRTQIGVEGLIGPDGYSLRE
jgi:hypothetical protein